MYGESWYTNAAVSAPVPARPRCFAAQRTPRPPTNRSVAIHNRWAIQSGMRSTSNNQYQGPDGNKYVTVWWGTHPANWRLSHVYGASAIRRPGSRYRYSLVSLGILPGAASSAGR